MIHKPIAWLIDTITGMTLIAGIINSDSVLKFFGILAAVITSMNHGYKLYSDIKNRKNGK